MTSLRIVSILTALTALLLVSACGSNGAAGSYKVIYELESPSATDEGDGLAANPAPHYRIGVVPKLNNTYFDVVKQGAQEAAWDIDVELLYEAPASADPDDQIEVIRGLMGKNVDAIAVSANDPDELVPVLEEAKSQGIKIVTWDSDAAPEAREFFVNMVDPETLGRHLLDTLAWSMGEKGDFAILTGSLAAANLNEWIGWIKKQQEEYYPNLHLLEIVPTEDDPDKAYEAAKSLLAKYPGLDGIIGNSSVGPPRRRPSGEGSGRGRPNPRRRPLDAEPDARLSS
ncbi:substrate-binding domain-containing protein [Cohnella fermenti]|uniref:substrate-binding domain-containing protein n=1 Tax=Cohnella fermenti TaxID=2565925 RepID=UPI001E631572|nr:substrate-binding domain-containing protein [Cohnella fermenti]